MSSTCRGQEIFNIGLVNEVKATRFLRGPLKPYVELRYFHTPSMDRFLAVHLRRIIFCDTPGATSQSSRQRSGRSNGDNEIEIISRALVRNDARNTNVRRIGSDVYLAIICGKMICPALLRSPLFSSLSSGGMVLLEKYGGHGSRGKGQNNTLYALYLRLICKFSGEFYYGPTTGFENCMYVRTF
jgi:hypothetical protein